MDRRLISFGRLGLALALALSIAFTAAFSQRKKKNEEPKTQVLPLPKELPMALAAPTEGLDFHLSPLLKKGRLSAQIHDSLDELIRDTRGETIIRLRAFVAGAGDARRVQAMVSEIFSDRRLPLPVLSILQVGALGDEAAQVVLEAVVSTRRSLNANGLAFLSGQPGNTWEQAVDRLAASSKKAGVAQNKMLACTCFAARISDYEAMRTRMLATFPGAAVNIVQALRDPADGSALCGGIGQLAEPMKSGPVTVLEDARATQVNTPQLVFTGLQLEFGNYLDDASTALQRLERAAYTVNPVESPVAVQAFALDNVAVSAIRKTIRVPHSLLTVQAVEGLPAVDASAGIEAVLAPNVAAPSGSSKQ